MHTDLVCMCLPLIAMAVCFYGIRVALLCGTAVITANLSDRLVALLRRQKYEASGGEAFAAAHPAHARHGELLCGDRGRAGRSAAGKRGFLEAMAPTRSTRRPWGTPWWP